MNKYYSNDSLRYPNLIEQGFLSWDGDKTIKDYIHNENEFIYEKALSCSRQERPNVLVLGCGTGKQAIFFAQKKCNVTGVDLSLDAIELANKMALQLKVDINYIQADVLEYVSTHKDKFDLIIDAHLLHCICFKEERATFLNNIKESLNPDGVFVVDTMTHNPSMTLINNTHYIYQETTSILWYKLPATAPLKGITKLNNEYATPQRYIAPFDVIEKELVSANFKFLYKEELVQHPDEPNLGLFICQENL